MYEEDMDGNGFDYDAAVIGGGPAGATFARLAGARMRVAVLERQGQTDGGMPPARAGEEKHDGRGKCCGGLLAPDAQKQLAIQGLTLPRNILVDPQIFAVRTIDLSPGRPERYYQRSYVNISRARFDEWLRSLLPPDVLIGGAAVLSVRRMAGEQGGFAVDYRRGGQIRTLTARTVVGADGGYSMVRRTFFPDAKIRRYVAVQEWYSADDRSPFYGALFDAELTDCYGWLISKDDYQVLGGAFPTGDPAGRFQEIRKKLEGRGITFGRTLRREGCMVCRPQRISELCTGGDGVFLAGEAAGFISPSSLEGISWALESGALLARVLTGGKEEQNARYHAATAGLRRRLAGKLLKSPFLYNPIIRRMILRAGIFSLPVENPIAINE